MSMMVNIDTDREEHLTGLGGILTRLSRDGSWRSPEAVATPRHYSDRSDRRRPGAVTGLPQTAHSAGRRGCLRRSVGQSSDGPSRQWIPRRAPIGREHSRERRPSPREKRRTSGIAGRSDGRTRVQQSGADAIGRSVGGEGWSGKSRLTSKLKCGIRQLGRPMFGREVPCRQVEPGPSHFAIIGKRQRGENRGAIRIVRHHGEQIGESTAARLPGQSPAAGVQRGGGR